MQLHDDSGLSEPVFPATFFHNRGAVATGDLHYNYNPISKSRHLAESPFSSNG